MTRSAILVLAVLTGCAATPEEARQKLPYLSEYHVCEAAMLAGPEVAYLAQQEAIRRGLRCRDYAQAVMQRQANQNQAVQNFIQSINPPAQPMPFPRSTTCRSRRVGNQVETICD